MVQSDIWPMQPLIHHSTNIPSKKPLTATPWSFLTPFIFKNCKCGTSCIRKEQGEQIRKWISVACLVFAGTGNSDSFYHPLILHIPFKKVHFDTPISNFEYIIVIECQTYHSWSSGEGMRPAVPFFEFSNLPCHQLWSSLLIICIISPTLNLMPASLQGMRSSFAGSYSNCALTYIYKRGICDRHCKVNMMRIGRLFIQFISFFLKDTLSALQHIKIHILILCKVVL